MGFAFGCTFRTADVYLSLSPTSVVPGEILEEYTQEAVIHGSLYH